MTPEDVQKCIEDGRAALMEFAEMVVDGTASRAEVYDLARVEVDTLMSVLDEAADLEAVHQMGRERLVAAHGSGGTVGQLRNLSFVLDHIDRQVADAAGTVRQAEAVAERMRQALGEAHVERRVIDKLRDRHRNEWQEAESQADRALMDDIALSRFVQRNTPGSAAPTVGEGRGE